MFFISIDQVSSVPADFVALSVGPPVQNRNASPPPSAPAESHLSHMFWPYSQTIETTKPVSSFADMGMKQQLPTVHDDSQIQVFQFIFFIILISPSFS
jgi:hypothetical protein